MSEERTEYDAEIDDICSRIDLIEARLVAITAERRRRCRWPWWNDLVSLESIGLDIQAELDAVQSLRG